MDKTTSTNNLIEQTEKSVMAEDPGQDLPVKPQQLIGGINGMVLHLHKMNSRLEESQQTREEQEEKIKRLDARNLRMKEEISELTKTKERFSEQSAFLEKSLQRQKHENHVLMERLKEAEVQLGESGTVFENVRSLESKNEMLNVKMSSIVFSTEEEIAKVITERDHYLKLLEEVHGLNERNKAMYQTLVQREKTSSQEQEKVKILLKKTEEGNRDIALLLKQLAVDKETYENLTVEKEGARVSSVALEEENKEMTKKMQEFETRYGGLGRNIKELRKSNKSLEEDLATSEKEKEKLKKEVNVLKERLATATRLAREHTTSAEKAQRTKQYATLEKQIKMLVESCGNTSEQLEHLKGSVDENRDLLQANIVSVTSHHAELSKGGTLEDSGVAVEHMGSMFSQEYFEVVVEMQDLLKHLQIRDEELANLEKLAGLPEQRELQGVSLVSSIRGLINMKDAQLSTLEKERAELVCEIDAIKRNGYKQAYVMEEMQKEREDIVAKMTSCQQKHQRLEDEKEGLRKDLLVKNATDKMTETYISNLKQENEKCKAMLQKYQETFKEKFNMMKTDYDQKLEEREELINNLRSRLNEVEHKKQRMEHELNLALEKDAVIKEKIITMFGK